MQEFDQVMHAAGNCQQAFVLAIVFNTSGSTYRRPGAVMSIREDGSMVGAVSGDWTNICYPLGSGLG